MPHSYKISKGNLSGDKGSWSLKSISAVYKEEGGRMSLKKWAITLAGLPQRPQRQHSEQPALSY